MTALTCTKAVSTHCGGYDETITATLLDALCSPQLYEIAMRDGQLLIKPRPHMHPRPMSDIHVVV